jgi:hypothetical protein
METITKKVKKSGLDLAFEDIEKGRIHRLITPKNGRAERSKLRASAFFPHLF